MKITSCPFLVAAVVGALVGGGCSGGSVVESKLIGSWALDAPSPKTFVYTFQTNHTYSMALSGESGAVVGPWELHGDRLVMAMGAISNEFGSGNIFGTMNTASTNRISRLTDGVMVWRAVGELQGTKLKRVGQGTYER